MHAHPNYYIKKKFSHKYKKNFLASIQKFSHKYKKNFPANIKKFSREYKKIFLKNFFSVWVYYKTVEFTRKEYDIIAKNIGIIEPQKMSTQELLNTLSRYNSRHKGKSICRKLSKIGLGKIAKKKEHFKK